MEFTKEQWLDRISSSRIETLKAKEKIEKEKYTKRISENICMYRNYESSHRCPVFSCSNEIIPSKFCKESLENYFYCPKHRSRNILSMTDEQILLHEQTLQKIEEFTGLTPEELAQAIFG